MSVESTQERKDMESTKYFSNQKSKLQLDAFVKSLLSGLVVGFAANFIVSAIFWFISVEHGLLISLGVLAVVTAIATVIFYFKAFYPTVIKSARRLDRLGLEERLITMVEYENDDSYIAEIQRQDAKQALEQVENKSIKIKIRKLIWVSLIVAGVMGSSMTTITTLADAGLIDGGDDFIEGLLPEEREVFYAVTYDVEEGGSIDGEADQLILKGQDATAVTAVPDEGFVFLEWSDGYKKPYRMDKKIEKDLEIFAVFEPTGEGEGDGEGQGEGEGDGDGSQEGESGKGSSGSSSEQEGQEGNNKGDSAGGRYDDWNQIIDGETYYRDKLLDPEYSENLAHYLENNRDKLSPEEIKIIEHYLGIV